MFAKRGQVLLMFGFLGHSLLAVAACGGAPFTDIATGRRWSREQNCDHPGWPARLVPLGNAEKPAIPAAGLLPVASQALPAVVRRGASVELWSHAAPGLHLTGVALESASIGQIIPVRGGLGATALHGIVRGPHSVELVSPGWEGNP